MKKDKNLSFEKEITKRNNRRSNFWNTGGMEFLVVCIILSLGVFIPLIFPNIKELDCNRKYDTYIEQLEIISAESNEVTKLGNRKTEKIGYVTTEYYFTVRYKNSLSGTAEVQVTENTYNKYTVGDTVRVKISETYFIGDNQNYLEDYEIKVVNE